MLRDNIRKFGVESNLRGDRNFAARNLSHQQSRRHSGFGTGRRPQAKAHAGANQHHPAGNRRDHQRGNCCTVGTAAAGDAARPGSGPSLMLSFAITAGACAFTALCYAEVAAMVPISGSAYTYSYATLGELDAWIIGWHLMLEYAIGNLRRALPQKGFLPRGNY